MVVLTIFVHFGLVDLPPLPRPPLARGARISGKLQSDYRKTIPCAKAVPEVYCDEIRTFLSANYVVIFNGGKITC